MTTKEIQEQERDQQQAEATEEPKLAKPKANWWKRIALIIGAAFILLIGGLTLLTVAALMSMENSESGNSSGEAATPANQSNPGNQVDSQPREVQEEPKPSEARPTKDVKIVATSLDGPADYSASDDRWKIADGQQIEGTKTFTYENIPEKDGILVDVINMKWRSYVSVEVYEDGKLVAQDEDNHGWAQVSY